LGSQAIFQEYEKSGRDVKAMLQQDSKFLENQTSRQRTCYYCKNITNEFFTVTGYVQGTLNAGKPEAVG